MSSLDLDDLFQIIISIYLDTVFDAKRLIGRGFNDPNVQEDIRHFPFRIIEKNSKPIIYHTIEKERISNNKYNLNIWLSYLNGDYIAINFISTTSFLVQQNKITINRVTFLI